MDGIARINFYPESSDHESYVGFDVKWPCSEQELRIAFNVLCNEIATNHELEK